LLEKFNEYAKKMVSKIDAYIYDVVKGEPETLYDAALHLIKAGGKRLRPIIVLAVAETLGADPEKALPFAAAVEIVHNFTLIHDDIIDEDEMRRGVPTVHKLWGQAIAITAGDLLYAKAFEALSRAVEVGISANRVVKALDYLARACSTIAEGQAMDILFEDREDVSIDEYLIMVYKKTGALFEASAVLGGLVVTDDEPTLNALETFGRNLGIAFQIKDDILGLVGKEEVIGKPVYSDIREGKKTILVVYALQRLDPEKRERLLSILGNKTATREELEEAANLIISTGALDFANRLAREYAEKARVALHKLPEKETRRVLEDLIDYVLVREK